MKNKSIVRATNNFADFNDGNWFLSVFICVYLCSSVVSLLFSAHEVCAGFPAADDFGVAACD
jgi:hypothetical protein